MIPVLHVRIMDKENTKRNKPKCLHQEIVAKSRLFAIESLALTFSNGARRTYERLVRRSHGAVLIIPLQKNNEHILLVKEYAAGTERYELGFPKGLVEANESPFEAANRELKEEVGFGAMRFHKLKSLSSSPSYFGLMVDLIVAEDLYPEKLKGDEPEPMDIVSWPVSELDALLLRDDFTEARSVAALYLLKQYLSELGG